MARHSPRRTLFALLTAACGLLLSSCGGGGGGSDGGDGDPGDTTPGDFGAAQNCSLNNPYRKDARSARTAGSLASEKAWLRGYFDRAYLWYDEVPQVNPNLATFSDEGDVYGSLDAYFNALLTPGLTPSGKRRDQFSFTYPTAAWDALANSGQSVGYGIEFYFASRTPPRGIRIAYVDANTPAANPPAPLLQRGDVLFSVDGVGADDGSPSGVRTLNAAMFPDQAGSTHTFSFLRNGNLITKTMVAQTTVKDPVPTTKVFDVGTAPNTKAVGYMVFNDHLATAEDALIRSINTLKTNQVTDLVLDLRYNGGGYLYIASELAYMIAGPARTSGATFERLQFNAKRIAETNSPDAITPFYDATCASAACALPHLDLNKVYVITGPGTCSASEAVINGLRGVGVTVQLIGDTTCGKPYGFTARDNCGISYFPIEFKGVNAQGFGDYADGFSPAVECQFADDFSKPLGDATEGLLSGALYAQANAGLCPPAAAGRATPLAAHKEPSGFLVRSPFRENRILKSRH